MYQRLEGMPQQIRDCPRCGMPVWSGTCGFRPLRVGQKYYVVYACPYDNPFVYQVEGFDIPIYQPGVVFVSNVKYFKEKFILWAWRAWRSHQV